MSRRRKSRKTKKYPAELMPDALAFREKENRKRRTFAKNQARRESTYGLSAHDAASQWLAAKEAGEDSPLLGDSRPWRSEPITPTQERELRCLGLNPFLLRSRTRGAAADAIAKAQKERGRR